MDTARWGIEYYSACVGHACVGHVGSGGRVMREFLISADSHVAEPVDLWSTALPASMRQEGPRVEMRDGAPCILVEDQVIRRFKSPGGKGMPLSESVTKQQMGSLVSLGAVDPDARLKDLDRDGVWGEVMYPNLAFFCVHRMRRADLQAATCRVYNDWIADTFFQRSDRFCPVAILPVLDIEATVQELRRVSKRGFKAALLPAHIDSRPYNDTAYEAVWREAAACGMPLSFHAGTGRTQTPAHGPGGAIVNYVVTVSSPMETIAYFCGSGVLERHPDLRIVIVECGSGWLAWALHAMDDIYHQHAMFVRPKLELLPSEYFRRQGGVTFQNDPVGFHNLKFTGDRCLLWGSDYPHPEGTWPQSREILARQLVDVPSSTADRILLENAQELYGFSVPSV